MSSRRSYVIWFLGIALTVLLVGCLETAEDEADAATPPPDTVAEEATPTPPPAPEATPTPSPDPTPVPEADDPEDEALFPIRAGDQWGYINRHGEVVVEPQWDRAFEFSDDRAVVRVEMKWGAIDTDGNVVVDIEYDRVHEFSEGLAAVGVGGEIGHHGTLVEADWGFVDADGDFVIEPQFEFAGQFSEGLAMVMVDGHAGFIDESGQFVIDPQFEWAGEFADGLANVRIDDLFGFVDSTGELMVDPAFECCEGTGFSDNRVWMVVESEYHLIDRQGESILEAPFDTAFSFEEGLSAVSHGGQWGYIDRNGDWKIEPQFEFANSFSEGLAAVQLDRKWGYINDSGSFVIEPVYDLARSFTNGLAVVAIGEAFTLGGGFDPIEEYDGWRYIDQNGDVIWLMEDESTGDTGLASTRVYIESEPLEAEIYVEGVEDVVYSAAPDSYLYLSPGIYRIWAYPIGDGAEHYLEYEGIIEVPEDHDHHMRFLIEFEEITSSSSDEGSTASARGSPMDPDPLDIERFRQRFPEGIVEDEYGYEVWTDGNWIRITTYSETWADHKAAVQDAYIRLLSHGIDPCRSGAVDAPAELAPTDSWNPGELCAPSLPGHVEESRYSYLIPIVPVSGSQSADEISESVPYYVRYFTGWDYYQLVVNEGPVEHTHEQAEMALLDFVDGDLELLCSLTFDVTFAPEATGFGGYTRWDGEGLWVCTDR